MHIFLCYLETRKHFSQGDVGFDVKNRNSSIDFLYIKSKCANFSCVWLDQ